jgi:hypothetical protein
MVESKIYRLKKLKGERGKLEQKLQRRMKVWVEQVLTCSIKESSQV